MPVYEVRLDGESMGAEADRAPVAAAGCKPVDDEVDAAEAAPVRAIKRCELNGEA
jgi:hypothetical protein